MNETKTPTRPPWKPKGSKDDVLNHWVGFAEGFSISPTEFYSRLEEELDRLKVPGLERAKIEYPEGGLLSDARLYFRLIRERLAFDTCAAPFGSGCFFSCRTVYSPAVLRLWHLLVVIFLLNLIGLVLVKPLGVAFALVAEVGLVVAIALVFRRTVASRLQDLDAAFLKTPVIGPIYERWFRKDTYYRQDARLVYLDVVSNLFKTVAEETVAAKGLKLVRQFERAPVFGELYKPVERPKKEPEQKK